MRKAGVLVGVLLVVFSSGAIAEADELFKARLTADQEVQVPPVETDTTAQFEIMVNKDATAGEYTRASTAACGSSSLTSTVVRPVSTAR